MFTNEKQLLRGGKRIKRSLMLMAFAIVGLANVVAASADEVTARNQITINSSANHGQAAVDALGNFLVANITLPNRDKDHNLSNTDISAQSFFYPLTIPPVMVEKGTLVPAYWQIFYYRGLPEEAPDERDVWFISARALPKGLMPDRKVISMTPTATGMFNSTLRIDLGNYFAESRYAIVVKAVAATMLAVSNNPAIAGQTIGLSWLGF